MMRVELSWGERNYHDENFDWNFKIFYGFLREVTYRFSLRQANVVCWLYINERNKTTYSIYKNCFFLFLFFSHSLDPPIYLSIWCSFTFLAISLWPIRKQGNYHDHRRIQGGAYVAPHPFAPWIYGPHPVILLAPYFQQFNSFNLKMEHLSVIIVSI